MNPQSSDPCPDLYDLEFERLRGILVLHPEVDVAAALAGLAHVGVEGEQREGAVLPEAELNTDPGSDTHRQSRDKGELNEHLI